MKLISFTDLSLEQKKEILIWRNNIKVREWMYCSKPIKELEHLKFIQKLYSDKTNKYFIVRKSLENIGVIYFNNIDSIKSECEFGLYTNPFLTIKRNGSLLIDIAVKYVFEVIKINNLKLEVFANNNKAIKLYKKYNFKETARKCINNKDIICMELKNENR